MIWRLACPSLLIASAIAVSPARACLPAPPIPRLEGETDAAYQARTDTLYRDQAARQLRERQVNALQLADMIFIGRDTAWSPPLRMKKRHGRTTYVVPQILYPAPSYFKPISWLRGPKTTDLFQLRAANTDCGAIGFGDTSYSKAGDLFVFFARKRPISERTLIDAIALDSVNDAALTAFVAKYRKKAP